MDRLIRWRRQRRRRRRRRDAAINLLQLLARNYMPLFLIEIWVYLLFQRERIGF